MLVWWLHEAGGKAVGRLCTYYNDSNGILSLYGPLQCKVSRGFGHVLWLNTLVDLKLVGRHEGQVELRKRRSLVVDDVK